MHAIAYKFRLSSSCFKLTFSFVCWFALLSLSLLNMYLSPSLFLLEVLLLLLLVLVTYRTTQPASSFFFFCCEDSTILACSSCMQNWIDSYIQILSRVFAVLWNKNTTKTIIIKNSNTNNNNYKKSIIKTTTKSTASTTTRKKNKVMAMLWLI